MPVKVNIGLSKKVGLPDFGSAGASCHVEFELDGGYDNGSTERFQNAVRRAYAACRQAVEAEIASGQSGENVSVGGQHAASRTTEQPSTNNERRATSSQVRAIHAIANRNGTDLASLLSSQFGVSQPDELSIRKASALIDQLKNGTSSQTSGVMVSR